MTNTHYDIVVSGGGIAGLAAAIGFGQAGFSVQCIDPTPPITTRDDDGADLRTTAFLQPSQKLLSEIGLWERFAPFAAPLQVMRIVDAGGATPTPRVVKEFDASEISQAPFGWNLPNWLLRREMLAHLEKMDTVDLQIGVSSKTLFTRTDVATVGLSDGRQTRCKLVIAADGRGSAMRAASGISVRTTRYGQKALAFAVTHKIPHENVSTEVHRTGGPFTLVPLPDHNGQPCSAVVWLEQSAKAQALLQMDIETFETEMTRRSAGLFGPLSLASRRTIWPIISQFAAQMYGERVALVAEAAHVVPPIGAQGLNMSLGDIGTLLKLATENPEDLGSAEMLSAYHAERHSEVSLRVRGIDLLNRASMVKMPILRNARAMGLNALYSMAPVRKTLMQMGLGMR